MREAQDGFYQEYWNQQSWADFYSQQDFLSEVFMGGRIQYFFVPWKVHHWCSSCVDDQYRHFPCLSYTLLVIVTISRSNPILLPSVVLIENVHLMLSFVKMSMSSSAWEGNKLEHWITQDWTQADLGVSEYINTYMSTHRHTEHAFSTTSNGCCTFVWRKGFMYQ